MMKTKVGLQDKTLKCLNNVSVSYHRSPMMIIEIEDRFCKVAQVF